MMLFVDTRSWKGPQSILMLVTFLTTALLHVGLGAQEDRDSSKDQQPAKKQRPAKEHDTPKKQDRGADHAMMVALEAIPGHIQSKSTRMDDGMEVIFSWWEDKDSLLEFYESDFHQGMIQQFFGDRKPRTALKHIDEDAGPLMSIAAITPAKRNELKNVQMPIRQISIEVYQPLRAGLYIGGGFTPKDARASHTYGDD